MKLKNMLFYFYVRNLPRTLIMMAVVAITVFFDSTALLLVYPAIIVGFLVKNTALVLVIMFGIPGLIQLIVSCSVMKTVKIWLFSIPVQAVVYSILWFMHDAYAQLSIVYYFGALFILFAIQALGVGIRSLIRLIIRKIRARKQIALAE